MSEKTCDIYPLMLENVQVGFRNILVELRLKRGWSQQDLADAIGIHVQLIKRYEGGQGVPSFETLARIARAFGVTADFLIFDQGAVDGKIIDDAELLELFHKVQKLRAQEREAIRILLKALVERPTLPPPEQPRSKPRRGRTPRVERVHPSEVNVRPL